MQSVKIGNRLVGPNESPIVIAEIGINHNGDIKIAKDLINVAIEAGAHAVKFQKRTVDVVYSKEELAKPRENPFGTTNGDLKKALEFGLNEYTEIDKYCRQKSIMWFASCWDEGSVDFINQFNPVCYKIASASLTDDELLRHTRSKGKPVILSTGMSTVEQIDHAVEVLGKKDLVIMHCTSVYPTQKLDEGDHGLSTINLNCINTLRQRFDVPIGFSSHDTGIMPTYASVVMGACAVEKHITLYRAMWGSDHAASIEPPALKDLCRMIREFQLIKGDGIKQVYPEEVSVMKKLRRK